jgi:hypothetical protein
LDLARGGPGAGGRELAGAIRVTLVKLAVAAPFVDAWIRQVVAHYN